MGRSEIGKFWGWNFIEMFGMKWDCASWDEVQGDFGAWSEVRFERLGWSVKVGVK